MQDRYEALAELLKDEETAKTVLGSSPEEAQVNIKSRGLDFTVEELTKLADYTLASTENKNELNEESLDDVSGGVSGIAGVACGPLAFSVIARAMLNSAIIWRKK